MNKIISVVGPTASGKTTFALQLAQKYLTDLDSIFTGVDLISVDSRQVYRGIETLTGADIPDGFEEKNTPEFEYRYFQNTQQTINLHGVAIIEISQDWSVAHFKKFAVEILKKAWKHKRLPILVGGTGLYHQHLFSQDENLYIPPNKDIREKAHNMSLQALQKWLEKVDSVTFVAMNNSDKNNPRRIVRAIEKKLGKPMISDVTNIDAEYENTVYGMHLELAELESKITHRVLKRFSPQVFSEVKQLVSFCAIHDSVACSTLGAADVRKYLRKEISQTECLKNWSLHEYQYAKRQRTWFSKQSNIIWLDAVEKRKYT